MNLCPLCVGEIKQNKCSGCGEEMPHAKWQELKSDTMDMLMTHLYQSKDCDRKRERLRVKIAFKNIKGWAKLMREAARSEDNLAES